MRFISFIPLSYSNTQVIKSKGDSVFLQAVLYKCSNFSSR